MSTAQGERRLRLAATRSLLYSLPANELFELPGRPHVVFQLRTYSNTGNVEEAAQQARNDSPFLFKAFETGQIGPKRLARMHGERPRIATIHEYLDWTVTAQAAEGDEDLDFDGFRVLVILPRYRSGWPPPGGDGAAVEEPRKQHLIGAPKPPIPALQTHGKPVTAATIRSGPGYLEIPFVATHENKRGRGYCRCLVEAIEEIARALGLKKLMLCSTNDSAVQSTWQHLGFDYASDEQMEEWDILHTDLVYLQNTTQMHKDVPPRKQFKSVIIRHEFFKQRCYAFVGQKRPQRPPGSNAGLSMPATSRPRLSSKRSESTSRDGSQSFAARDSQLPFANGLEASRASGQVPHLDTSPLGIMHAHAATPQAAASASGRPAGRLIAHDADHQLAHAGAVRTRDEAMAGSGPPTPQPADGGGHSRPLHALATINAPSTSQTDLSRPEAVSAEQQHPGAEQDGAVGLEPEAGPQPAASTADAAAAGELLGPSVLGVEAGFGVGMLLGTGPWLPLPAVVPPSMQHMPASSPLSSVTKAATARQGAVPPGVRFGLLLPHGEIATSAAAAQAAGEVVAGLIAGPTTGAAEAAQQPEAPLVVNGAGGPLPVGAPGHSTAAEPEQQPDRAPVGDRQVLQPDGAG